MVLRIGRRGDEPRGGDPAGGDRRSLRPPPAAPVRANPFADVLRVGHNTPANDMRELETTLGGDRESFPETVWSSLLGTEGPPTPAREAALHQLITLYWRPVYKYVRTAGGATIEDAKDLTQEFFGYLLEGGVLSKYDREKGR